MEAVLSPKDVAKAIGVSESSLKRWADEGQLRVSRTAGGHRRILLTEAIRFIRENKHAIVRPDVLGLNELGELSADLRSGRRDQTEAALLEALQAGDGVRVRGIMVSWFLDGTELPALLDGPVRMTMQKLGELWQHSNEGIFIEHRATDLCVQALNHVRSLLPPAKPGAATAMGGAPSGDPYIMPTMMASMVLADLGYRTVNLGPDTPADVLIRAASKCDARLVWVSYSTDLEARRLEQQVDQIAKGIAPLNADLVVGGRQVTDALRFGRDNVHVVGSMHELALFAKGLRGSTRAPAAGD